MRRTLLLLPMVGALSALAAVGAPPAHADAGWRWPLPPPVQVVRGFDPPVHDWLPGHRGVDLAGRAGQQVLAAGDGIVTFAARVGTVPVVAVRHVGGLETTYQPVRALVRVGARLSAGAALGVLLPTPSHCAPTACLHWGLRRAGVYLDPLALVGRATVRLLPLLSGRDAGSWLVPAVSGASVGSSAVAIGWMSTALRRRHRRLPPGVVSLAHVRRQRQEAG